MVKAVQKRDPMGHPESIADMANELFSAVQRSQGQAFISDGWSGTEDREAFLEWVQDRLDWNNEASNKIRAFLRKHKNRRS